MNYPAINGTNEELTAFPSPFLPIKTYFLPSTKCNTVRLSSSRWPMEIERSMMRTSLVVGASRQSIAYRDCCEETESFWVDSCTAGSERIVLNCCVVGIVVGIDLGRK